MERTITTVDSIYKTNRCILVEGPPWGDAEFYGKWLLAATEADAFRDEAFKDSSFRKQVKPVWGSYIPDLGLRAFLMLMQLKEYRTSFAVSLDSKEGEEFIMMVGMGFFVPINGHYYQMAIPSYLTAEEVKGAILRYAETETEDRVLHPEYLVFPTSLMSAAQAKAWQDQWREIDEFSSNGGYRVVPRPDF
jgi:hypothetical protein